LMHPSLQRQLERLHLSAERLPTREEWGTFLVRVNQTYQQSEQEHYLLERSLAIYNNELRQLNSIQSLILDNSAVGIAFLRNRIFEWVNPRMPELFGYSLEQLRGAPTRILYPSDTAWEVTGSQAYPTLAQGNRAHLELQLQRADGTLFWCRMEGRALHPSDPQDGSVWIWEDITARRTAEDELRKANAIQTLILDNSTVGIAFVRNRKIEWANQRISEMLSMPIDQIQGASTRIIYSSDEVYQLFDTQVYDALSQGKWFEIDISVPNSGNFPRFGRIQGKALDPRKARDGSIWICEDVTERKLNEEALRQGQKLESLGVLAGGIAHDFNNLLTAILGNIQLSRMEMDEGASAQAPLRSAELAVLKASDLTKQMLAYSGKGRFVVKPHDLNQVVHEMTNLLKVSIHKKIELAFDLAPNLPCIEADAAQIHQVIMNLVTNASDAMGDTIGRLRVRTDRIDLDEARIGREFPSQGLVPGPHVLLEVSDTGCGISREVMERIFDPFFTTKSTGRGLGLSAMLGILKGHHAGITIESVVDRGTTFRIYFPAIPGDCKNRDVTAEEGARRFHGQVLLVDDEPAILASTSKILKNLGFKVLCAGDGQEAMEAIRESNSPFDLVLMDLSMPRMGGRETFHALQESHPEVPVILCSGYDEQNVVEELTRQGLAGFLQKPYHLKDLRKALSVALKRKP
jgi:PAS domain S-box-containing protein